MENIGAPVDVPDGLQRSARRPWWLQAMPWLGPAPALTRRQWTLLGVLGAAGMIENYDLALLGLALPQIQAGLGISERAKARPHRSREAPTGHPWA